MSMLTKILLVTTMITIFSQIIEQSSCAHLNSTNNSRFNRHISQRTRSHVAGRIKLRDTSTTRHRLLRATDLSSSSSSNMNLDSSETRRNQMESARPNNQVAPKRFKSSFRGSAVANDLNNNSSLGAIVNNNSSSSLNHNEIQVEPEEIPNQPRNWRRNVSSINGTIDVTEYQQDDLDRLYGDALLVYYKNFNETMPQRREIVSVNGTRTGTPIYRSDSSNLLHTNSINKIT